MDIYNSKTGSNSMRSLDQRCQSPMVLFNNVAPKFTDSGSRQSSSDENRPPPQPMRIAIASENNAGWAPKRTVSLGPRRPLTLNQRVPQVQEPATPEDHENYNRSADQLRTSLSELNKLIDESPQIRSPLFRSFLTTSTESVNTQKEDVEGDLANLKASCSVNNLKSMFESPSSSNSTLQPSFSKPPRSASPSVLRNSPWSGLTTSQTVSRPSLPPTDYTIRRTISTSSRPEIRNPYRTHYGV